MMRKSVKLCFPAGIEQAATETSEAEVQLHGHFNQREPPGRH